MVKKAGFVPGTAHASACCSHQRWWPFCASAVTDRVGDGQRKTVGFLRMSSCCRHKTSVHFSNDVHNK